MESGFNTVRLWAESSEVSPGLTLGKSGPHNLHYLNRKVWKTVWKSSWIVWKKIPHEVHQVIRLGAAPLGKVWLQLSTNQTYPWDCSPRESLNRISYWKTCLSVRDSRVVTHRETAHHFTKVFKVLREEKKLTSLCHVVKIYDLNFRKKGFFLEKKHIVFYTISIVVTHGEFLPLWGEHATRCYLKAKPLLGSAFFFSWSTLCMLLCG